MVRHDGEDDLLQGTLAFCSSFLLIRILHGILVFLVTRNHRRNLEDLALYVISLS